MIYTIDTITRKLQAASGRGPSPAPLIDCRDPDIVDLHQIVEAHIEQAVADEYAETPTARLTDVQRDFSDCGIFWHAAVAGHYSGHILLPDDFMRLVTLQMSDWTRAVYTAIDTTSAYYEPTQSRFAGISGNPERPTAAIVSMPEGQAVEFHSCLSAKATIIKASYIPTPRLDPNEGIDIAEGCIYGVIQRLNNIINS